MSLTTTLTVKGKKQIFVTEQYELGLYVAIYKEGNSIPVQGCLDVKEVNFHQDLRAQAKEMKDTFIKEESDPLNRSEVRQAQTEFAVAYCKRKGWKLSDTPSRTFEHLSKQQVRAITTRPGFKDLQKNLVWE